MKKTFYGYYRPTKEEFSQSWKNCSFVFDANVLLNVYRYSQNTRETFIDILNKISDRIWVPHQAALEYQRQRLEVIGEQESAYEKIQVLLNDYQKNIENNLNTYAMHPFIKVDIILKKINENCTEIKKELDTLKQKHPNLIDGDELRETITNLFEGKVGSAYSPDKLEEIYNTGKKRYDRSIPPGFEDKKKDSVRKYGDLVLWFQIIDHAKSTKKPVIFVTDDRKEDWWLKFRGKTIGPHPELIYEIFSTADVNFYMYQTEQFIEYAQKYLKEQVNQKAIEEIREIKLLDEENRKQIAKAFWAEIKKKKENEEEEKQHLTMKALRIVAQKMKEEEEEEKEEKQHLAMEAFRVASRKMMEKEKATSTREISETDSDETSK